MLRAFCFRFEYLSRVTLTTQMNSLARYSKRTVQLLKAVPIKLLGFRLFLLPVMGTFQRSITVLSTIGLKLCLKLEVDASYIPIQYPVNSTQDTAKIFSVMPTWLSHSEACLSRQL
jgi:hypothetical protein